MPEEGIQLKLERVLPQEHRPPLPAHKFFYTRVGGEIMLEVGYFDLVELRQALETTKQQKFPGSAPVHIGGQYTLSPQAALELLTVAQQLVEDLKSQGYLAVDK